LFVPVIASAVMALRDLSPFRWRVLAGGTVLATAALTEAWWYPPMGRTVATSLALWALLAAAVLRAEAAEARSRPSGQAAAPS
jgi:hypothetical protein